MARKNKISKEKSIRRTKFYTEFVICLCIIAGGAICISNALKQTKTVKQSDIYDDTKITEPTLPTEDPDSDPDKVIYESSAVNTKDKFKGELILVNEDHQYFGGGEELVSVLEKNDAAGRSYLGSYDYTCEVRKDIYEPMGIMVDDFYKLYHNDTLTVWGGYRTTEFQQQLYDDAVKQNGGEDTTLVAKPGFSEHESGYAIDFSDSETNEYNDDEDFKWFNENCYKYGFIERYPEGKESKTKIQYEPWHFRYVGIPHAYFMTANKICMEEYMELLSEHPYEGEHLKFADDEGRNYEVYFVASDDGSENTMIPVPAGKDYDISGNNSDGFIVTVYTDEKPLVRHKVDAQPENTTTEDTSAEDTSAAAQM